MSSASFAKLLCRLAAVCAVLSACNSGLHLSSSGSGSGSPSSVDFVSSGGTGSGTTYEGMKSNYAHRDPTNPCAGTDADGKALPNREIQLQGVPGASRTAALTRQACVALNPTQPLNVQDLQFAT